MRYDTLPLIADLYIPALLLSGHGRKAGCPAPPVQIRTYAANVYGSYFEYLARKRISG